MIDEHTIKKTSLGHLYCRLSSTVKNKPWLASQCPILSVSFLTRMSLSHSAAKTRGKKIPGLSARGCVVSSRVLFQWISITSTSQRVFHCLCMVCNLVQGGQPKLTGGLLAGCLLAIHGSPVLEEVLLPKPLPTR